MTHPSTRCLAAAALALLLAAPPALAGPGAHGPNGEHLDAPAMVGMAPSLPRVEAATEAFELVAELRASELAIVVDRFQTNEPVLNARLEVESGALKAVATYRAEQGDYVVSDAALLKALAAPGEHALVFTLVAGADSDLLDGTLVQAGRGAAAGGDHGHDHGDQGHDHHALERAATIGAGVLALGVLGAVFWRRQRRTGSLKPMGGL
jgi:hypothetical protein